MGVSCQEIFTNNYNSFLQNVMDSRFFVGVVSVLDFVSFARRLPEQHLHVDFLVGFGHLEELVEDEFGQVDDVLWVEAVTVSIWIQLETYSDSVGFKGTPE